MLMHMDGKDVEITAEEIEHQPLVEEERIEPGRRMTREEAVFIIYRIINSGILDLAIEEELSDVCRCIEEDSFDEDE